MTSKKTRRRTRPEPKARVRRRVRPDASADQPNSDAAMEQAMTAKKTRLRTRPEPKARVRRRVRPDAPADQPNSEAKQEGAEEPDNRRYDVGYGKPPEGTRFQPGQSGNPKVLPSNA